MEFVFFKKKSRLFSGKISHLRSYHEACLEYRRIGTRCDGLLEIRAIKWSLIVSVFF